MDGMVDLHSNCADFPSTVHWKLRDGIVASLGKYLSTRNRQIAGWRQYQIAKIIHPTFCLRRPLSTQWLNISEVKFITIQQKIKQHVLFVYFYLPPPFYECFVVNQSINHWFIKMGNKLQPMNTADKDNKIMTTKCKIMSRPKSYVCYVFV